MAYVLPQALVFQEFNLIPSEITNPLRACIFGGHADLHRHAEADEKVNINLGDYEDVDDTTYNWPDKTAGSLVDASYVKVFIDDAYLNFFEDLTTGDSTISPVSGSNNKVASDTVKFVDNGTTYPRTAAILRDVKKGDRAWIRGTSTLAATVGVEFELNTYIKDFEADAVSGTVGAGSEDAANLIDASSSSAVVVDATANTNDDTVLTVTDTNWNILEAGLQSETYTVTVTQSSTGGDFTSAKVNIISASGDDDVVDVAVGADTVATEYGVRELSLTFTANASEDLIAGDVYTVTVAPAHLEANLATTGSYAGTSDATYIIEVIEGGAYGTSKVQVTTDNGTDASGPIVITADGVGGDAATFAIGSHGVIIEFDNDAATGTGVGLAKGDIFYIVVTAATDGDFHTLVLGHSMSLDLASATDLDLKLFIKKDIQVDKNIEGQGPSGFNWDTNATQITINSGIQAYDADWVDSSGDLVALDVERGTVYSEYREWLSDNVGVINSLQDTANIATLAGPLDPDNPLKWGIFKALSNSNGTLVKYIAVADPNDDDDWADALEKAVGRDDVYGLVPLTHDKTVLDMFEGHVNSQSSPTAGRWRVAWVVADADDEVGHVTASTSSNGLAVQATIADNPEGIGVQYTYLSIDSANADIEDLGVRAGDVVRYLFSDDGFGNETYTEFVIDAVINETDVVLATAHSQAVTSQRVEIWHTRTMTELAAAIATNAGAWGNRRVRAVWPDLINSGGELTDGMFLAAALSGLSSGIVPHQGLTSIQVSGFDDAERSRDKFNGDQLNDMADSGVWIVTQDDDGNIITRHALTSDNTDLNRREEQVVRNVDSMSYLFLNRLSPFIGRANVTPSAIDIIGVEIGACIDFLKASGYTDTLGSQLIGGEITQLRPHALLRDRLVAVLDLEIPYPMNNIEIHLVV
jgi:hypothetical protein